MSFSTRLRQVVLAAPSLHSVSEELEAELGLSDGYHDPGVGAFGLTNVVYAIGGCFLEVVSPVEDGTTAGRLMERDGPGGYMAIFQTDDFAAARRRVGDLGIRVVWEIELEDITAMHLHPKDIGGAIVSVDQPDPPASWRWGGPAWTGPVVATRPNAIRGLTLRVDDPAETSERWAKVLGERSASNEDIASIDLTDQYVRFVPSDGERPGLCEIEIVGESERRLDIGGVMFVIASGRP